MLTPTQRQRIIPMLFLQTAIAMLLVFSINGFAQSAEDNAYRNAKQNKKASETQKRGLLNGALRWMADDSHGIVMGTIKSINVDNMTIKVLNQDVLIDEETLFLGTLKTVADLKTGRAVVITTEVKDDKLTAVEIYRLPKPRKRSQ
jgi:hypothetical protein